MSPSGKPPKSSSSGDNPTSAQPDFVKINWIWLDPGHLDLVEPRVIAMPRQYFEDSCQECQGRFVTELKKKFSFNAIPQSIRFWTPASTILIDSDIHGWAGQFPTGNRSSFITNPTFVGQLVKIPYPRSFDKALKRDIDNEDAVHLVVTCAEVVVVVERESSDYYGY